MDMAVKGTNCIGRRFLNKFDVRSVVETVKRNGLKWFGHMEHLRADYWVSACREIEMEGSTGSGSSAGRRTWNECVVEDMRGLRMTQERGGAGSWCRSLEASHFLEPSDPCSMETWT